MFLKTVFNQFSRNIWPKNVRHMSDKKLSTAEKVAAMSPNELVKNTVRLTEWNKRILVFSGRYKTMAEIPDTLPFEVVDKARNKTRIKVCNIMIVMTIIGSVYMAMSGKRAAERGDTVSKMNIDWHKDYNERAKKEAEEAVKKA